MDITTHRLRKVQTILARRVDVDTPTCWMCHTKHVMLGHYIFGAEDKSPQQTRSQKPD